MLQLFDVLKAGAEAKLDDAECELAELGAELELEEDERDDDIDNDNDDGWVDVQDVLLLEEKERLDTSVRLVKLVLVKVQPVYTLISHRMSTAEWEIARELLKVLEVSALLC